MAKSQKNQVSAAEVVSCPAKMKLMIMSVMKLWSEWPEVRKRERRSTEGIEELVLSSVFLSLMILLAYPRTSAMAIRSRFSDPMSKNFFSFQTNGIKDWNLKLLILTASSNAFANFD